MTMFSRLPSRLLAECNMKWVKMKPYGKILQNNLIKVRINDSQIATHFLRFAMQKQTKTCKTAIQAILANLSLSFNTSFDYSQFRLTVKQHVFTVQN